MIKVIPGVRGSGKTKIIINEVDKAKNGKGHVVVVQKDSGLREEITHEVRLVNSDEYHLKTLDDVYGFICGICASDYDVTDIFFDGFLRITKETLENVALFFERIEPVLGDIKLTLTLSEEESKFPDSIKKYF